MTYIFDDEIPSDNIYIDDTHQVNEISKATLINLYNAFKIEESLQLREYIYTNRPDIMNALNLDDIDIFEKSKDEIMYNIKQEVQNLNTPSNENSTVLLKISEVFFHALVTAFAFTLYSIVTKNGERIKSSINSITSIKLKSKNKEVYSLNKKYMIKELNEIESVLDKFISNFINKKIKIYNKKEYIAFVKKIENTIKPLEDIIGFEIIALMNDTYKIFKDKDMVDDKYVRRKTYLSHLNFSKEKDVDDVLKKLSGLQYKMDNKYSKLLEDIDTILTNSIYDSESLTKDQIYFKKQAIKFQFSVFKLLIRSLSDSMKKISSALNSLLDKTEDEDDDGSLTKMPVRQVK